MSPETTLLTPRAEHPPGESGREKSRAALDMEKSHVNQCAPPQLFPFRCMGVPVYPSPDAGTGPPAEGNLSAALPPGVRGSPWRQGSGTGTVRPPSPRCKTYF